MARRNLDNSTTAAVGSTNSNHHHGACEHQRLHDPRIHGKHRPLKLIAGCEKYGRSEAYGQRHVQLSRTALFRQQSLALQKGILRDHCREGHVASLDGKRPTLYLARAVGGPIRGTATTRPCEWNLAARPLAPTSQEADLGGPTHYVNRLLPGNVPNQLEITWPIPGTHHPTRCYF